MVLEIFIVTYNRSKFLKNTLQSLAFSDLKEFQITILNNSSTDDTVSTAESFRDQFDHFRIMTHRNNIGACANIMKAFELAEADYVWVLCDDDLYNFDYVDDIIRAATDGVVDLMQTGAHPENAWDHGYTVSTPAKLLHQGHHYFKFGSFMPSNIFRTELLQKKYLIEGYKNIGNGFPYAAYLFDLYKEDRPIYITKERTISPGLGVGHVYSSEEWFLWWIRTCKLLKEKEDVHLAFWDHFDTNNKAVLVSTLINLSENNEDLRKEVLSFSKDFFMRDEYRIFRNFLIKSRLKKIIKSAFGENGFLLVKKIIGKRYTAEKNV